MSDTKTFTEMKLISLWQPWATAMAWLTKLNETRSWSTKWRGPTAIHAAKQNGTSLMDIRRLWTQKAPGVCIPDIPRGAIVAYGDLVDVVPVEDYLKYSNLTDLERSWGDYSPGRFIWIFKDMHRITPLPYKAAQGLRAVPEEIVSQVYYLKAS